MSHELRTPLNAIIGFSQVLRKRMFGEINAKQEEYLDDILSSGNHLLSLINDVLDLSKVEAGQVELEVATFSLREALERGVVMVREPATKNGVRLSLELAPDVDLVDGDERRLRQVVFNLLSNAVKFTPGAGASTSRRPRWTARCRCRSRTPGRESRPRTRSGSSRSSSRPTSAWSSVRAPASGSRSRSASSSCTAAASGSRARPGMAVASSSPSLQRRQATVAGERILVVEDNEKNMKLFRDVLQAKGYSTLEATTGEDAVELARTLDPALVLMDVQLPGIDGIEALAQLRGDERTSAIPVVALTAQAMRGDRERFLDVGFDGYLSKPVDVVELLRVVEDTAIMTDRPPKILVVDDVPENVRLLKAVLVPRGYEVVTATDGRAALDLVEAEKPDLILLDVMMPGLDGYAVCSQLRANDDTAVLPGDHGHVEHRPGEDEGDRGRRGRLHPEAVQPRRAAHARAVAAPDQALPRHDQGAGG